MENPKAPFKPTDSMASRIEKGMKPNVPGLGGMKGTLDVNEESCEKAAAYDPGYGGKR